MSSFRTVTAVTVIATIMLGLHAQDFFDDDLDGDTDLITYQHDHDDSNGHDLDRHDSHSENGIAQDAYAFKARGVFLQTSAGQASHSVASNEHIDRGHDHIRVDGKEIDAVEDSLVTNEVPLSATGQPLSPNGAAGQVHVPDLTNHALAGHSQFTGLHGMPTPTVLPAMLGSNV